MRVILDSKRRLPVPMSLATMAPGDQFEARFDADDDAIVFRRIAAASDWFEVLKDCPTSMGGLPRRRRALPRRKILFK